VNWKRAIGWSLLMLIAANLVGFLDGVIMAHSEITPETIDRTVTLHRIARRIAVAVVSIFCYWRLGAGAPAYRGAHIAVAFVLVQLLDTCLSLLLGAQVSELLEPWSMLRAALYALAGYLLARLRRSRDRARPVIDPSLPANDGNH